MNKYQETLDYFCDHCMEYEDDYDWKENPCGEYVKVDEEILKEKRDVLQKLVDKATHKKPVLEPMCFLGDMAKHLVCPACHSPIVNVWSTKTYKPRYCHYCGQALKWKEEDGDAK